HGQRAIDRHRWQLRRIQTEEGDELARLRNRNVRVLDAAGALLATDVEAKDVNAPTRLKFGSSQGEVATAASNSALAAPTAIVIEVMPSIRPRLRFLSKARLFIASLPTIAFEAHIVVTGLLSMTMSPSRMASSSCSI